MVLAALLGVTHPAGAAEPPPVSVGPPVTAPKPAIKHIFAVPPLQWDSDLLTANPVQHDTASDLANLTGGLVFGMEPTDVNNLLPDPMPGVSWTNLPAANEFPEDVRYFWTGLSGAPGLQTGITPCAGTSSYVAFLFRRQGLFRISYRFVPDAACPDPASAVAAIFARYVLLGRSVALAVHYQSGGVQVVDVTDPTADYLIPTRWQNRGR